MKKILNFSHADLDGFGCQLSINEKFNPIGKPKTAEINFKNMGYGKIPEMLDKIEDLNYYDAFIITDLNFIEEHQEKLYETLKKHNFKGKFIYIDHHLYNDTTFLEKIKNEFNASIFIDIEKSASLKTFELFIKEIDTEPRKNLQKLIEMIDIYDLWQKDNPKFKIANLLNDLFWDAFNFDFTEKMISQNYKLTDSQKNLMKGYIKKVENTFKEFQEKGIILNKGKFLISFDYKYSNHYSEFFNYEIGITVDINTKNVSIRIDNENKRDKIFKIIEKHNGKPGGHGVAFGAVFNDKKDISSFLDEIVRSF